MLMFLSVGFIKGSRSVGFSEVSLKHLSKLIQVVLVFILTIPLAEKSVLSFIVLLSNSCFRMLRSQ